VLQKRRHLCTRLHGIIFHMTVSLIFVSAFVHLQDISSISKPTNTRTLSIIISLLLHPAVLWRRGPIMRLDSIRQTNAARRVHRLVLVAALPGKHLAILNQVALRVFFLDRQRFSYDRRRQVYVGRLNTFSERDLTNGDK
jgi:hypothetical protein